MIICAQTHAHTRTHILAHKEKRGGKEKKARPHTYLRASAHSLSQHKSTHANTRTFSHHTLNTKAHANTSTYICIYVFHVHMSTHIYICTNILEIRIYNQYTRHKYICVYICLSLCKSVYQMSSIFASIFACTYACMFISYQWNTPSLLTHCPPEAYQLYTCDSEYHRQCLSFIL